MSRSHKFTSVNVATLKAQLSKYLRLVQEGEPVVILDHKLPVARLIPYEDHKGIALSVTHAAQSFSDFSKMRGQKTTQSLVMDSLQILLKDRASR